MADHDHPYKRLFSQPAMVAELVKGFCPEIAEGFHEDSLTRGNGSYVTRDYRDREDDIIWHLTWGDRDLVLYLLIEFQSTPDPGMPERICAYMGLLYQDLRAQQVVAGAHGLPLVIPIVLFNGDMRWTTPTDLGEAIGPLPDALERFRPRLGYLLIDETRVRLDPDAHRKNAAAAVFRLEQSISGDDYFTVGVQVREYLQAHHPELLDEFSLWSSHSARSTASERPNPFEGAPMLANRFQQWEDEIAERARTEGVAEGRAEGVAEGQAEGEIRSLRRLLTEGVIAMDQAQAILERLVAEGIVTRAQADGALGEDR